MDVQTQCKSQLRRQVARDAGWNGIDYLEVNRGNKRILLVHCLQYLSAGSALARDNVRIEPGAGGAPVRVVKVTPYPYPDPDPEADPPRLSNVLLVETDSSGDFSTYRLSLTKSSTDFDPPKGFDRLLSQIEFSFKVDCPSDFDLKPSPVQLSKPVVEPPIDYLAKDYASFRQLMLDRLAVITPDWKERNPADTGIALVEALAYAADHLSYYQDSVATEAYLGTARKRVSARRHARLLDYSLHDGCNARAWVRVEVSANEITLKKDSQLLTRLEGFETRIQPKSDAYDQALAQAPQVFETLHDVRLLKEHNEFEFYTWGEQECTLSQGATCATLKGSFPNLEPGNVLIFKEVRGPASGRKEDADPNHRHVVRLSKVTVTKDPLGGQFHNPPDAGVEDVTEIEWMAGDGLPFDLYVSPVETSEGEEPATVALGNVVLADHGRTIAGDEELEPDSLPYRGHYRPTLLRRHVTQRVPYDDEQARSQAVATALVQDPRATLPAVQLQSNGENWSARRDLLASDRFALDFVVEMESDGRATLRFGDNVLGREPVAGSSFKVAYRVGNGSAGNVGAGAIAHAVSEDEGIGKVSNPLPARGGRDPETIEQIRLYAPQAFYTQKRAVTEEDYAEIAQRHPDVQRAVANLRWTGSWYTVFVTVDRKGGRPVDAAFERELREFLASYRLAGHDLEVDSPILVPLDIALTVQVETGYLRSQVKTAILETFGNADLPDGRRGFFHPDNFTFGEPVYLSKVIAAAMQVPGVEWVNAERFQRWRQPSRGEIDEGLIKFSSLEIALLDNDPSAPQNGKVEFFMTGGL
jgi:hypothetical protein